jgi:hypothetical protein
MNETSITTVSLSSRRWKKSPLDLSSTVPGRASGQLQPRVWLGASSPFGLALPEAKPTASHMYAPRGVWIDENRLVVSDSGNHRVLIWNQHPTRDGQEADIVLGQPDFFSEGPAQGGSSYARGMHLPTGVLVINGQHLLVADAWHHRILVWNDIPTRSDQPADYALGQVDMDHVEPNRGKGPGPNTLYWPYGLAWIAGRFYVADTGNRRVLAWNGLPCSNQPADWVIGQGDFCSNQENRGGSVCGNSFRWPHAIAGNTEQLWIADAGNHRILGWSGHPVEDRDADWILGQPDSLASAENPYTAQGPRALRFPYGIFQQSDRLMIADTANNRVLFWHLPLNEKTFAPATDLLGQTDFDQNGENRWDRVAYDTLCWPYGIASHDECLAIADSGNNRVMLWDVSAVFHDSHAVVR